MHKEITRLLKNALKISYEYNENNERYCYFYSVKKFEKTKLDSLCWWGSAVPVSELRLMSILEIEIKKFRNNIQNAFKYVELLYLQSNLLLLIRHYLSATNISHSWLQNIEETISNRTWGEWSSRYQLLLFMGCIAKQSLVMSYKDSFM